MDLWSALKLEPILGLWSALKAELIFGFMISFEDGADFGFMVSFEGGADFGIYGLAGVEGCLDLWFDLRSCLELAVFS